MDQINIQIVKKLREMVRQEMEEGGAVFATKDGLPHLEYDPEKEKKWYYKARYTNPQEWSELK